MIDCHIHVTSPRLPGAGPLSPLLEGRSDALAAALRQEMQEAGITHCLAMGSSANTPEDPLGVADILKLAALVPGLGAIGVADPLRSDPDHLRRVSDAIAAGQVRALKCYLGYSHFGPDHLGYRPYYEIAERCQIPVFFHTGDTYSPRARLRLAHPLAVDDVAVDHPKTRFVLAHFGNPWFTDAAAVVYKNVNVWADLSGLLIGDAANLTSEERRDVREDVIRDLQRAFRYAERPNRFLYGSDWPLVPMAAYRDFIRAALPPSCHEQVFEENARLLFRL
jgi:predicted TIM-barrel fold metal-dependent hydrolase